MAYLDPKPMTQSRLISIVLVVALHALLLYALITGGYKTAVKTLEELEVIDVKEEAPPPEKLPPPPPPKDNLPPPPPQLTPPPIVTTNAPVINSTPPVPPSPPPPIVQVPSPPAPVITPPSPPPSPPAVASRAQKRSGSISDDDYPPSAIRAEEQGRSVATFTVGTDGRVTSCSASGAGPILDAETCKLIQRRFRYTPAKSAGGEAVSETLTQAITWRLPK